MNRDFNIEILAEKEVRGTLTDQERNELEDWLSADPLNRKEFDELTEIVRLAEAGLESVDPKTDSMWADLQSSIAENPTKPLRKRPSSRRIWAIAASVAVICVVGYFVIQGGLPGNNGGETLEYAASAKAETFVLPDQSEVQLEPGSRLSLAPGFNEEERRMKLEGKALFTVTRNEEKPFVVEAGGTETKVLGTVFELNTSADAGDVALFVRSGKVSFAGKDADQPSILTANMHGDYDAKTGAISVKKTNANTAALNASPTEVVASNQTIEELLPELEKVFDAEFDIPESLLETHITGTFSATAEEDMIAALELIMGGKFEKKGAIYTFIPRR